jgi:four helix bundle protein
VGVSSYRELKTWQTGMALAAEVYRLSRGWPKDELYGLTSQARRAAGSIPANIAEGYGRESRGSYMQFLKIARGSLRELETHLLLAERVGVAASGTCEASLQFADELGRMLHSQIRRLGESS